jgi:hypothetical protein
MKRRDAHGRSHLQRIDGANALCLSNPEALLATADEVIQ